MIHFFETNFPAAISIFLIGAVVAAVLATAMTKSAVCLKLKAKLSDGIVGGILLGVITSIPELITGIQAVTEYAKGTYSSCGIFGDAVGSDMFCLFILGIVLISCVAIFVRREVNQVNTFTIAFVGLGTVFCLLAGIFDNGGIIYESGSPVVWHGFNLFSIFILFSYAASVFFMLFGSRVKPKAVVLKGAEAQVVLPTEQKSKRLWFDKLPLWAIITLFVLFALLLTGCSVILAASCDGLIVHWEIPPTFGRSLLLGVATSLPELISLISLAMDKEYNMCIDSMAGSCGFNLTILFVCNIVYAIMFNPSNPGHMYSLDAATGVELTLFLIEIIFLIIYLVVNSQSIKQYLTKKQAISINSVMLSFVILTYVIYLILGFVTPQ